MDGGLSAIKPGEILILSTDVGSLPPRVKMETLDSGALLYNSLPSLLRKIPSTETFETEVVSAFVDKINLGLDLPTYPQFRDMNKMFIALILNNNATIPELDALKCNLSEIKDRTGFPRIPIKVCLTGPYTMSSIDRTLSIEDITDGLCKILENSLFKTKYGEVKQICIDEPSFGFLDDPVLDYGSHDREFLRGAWENMCHIASSYGIETSIHLHNTSDNLFWEVKHLKVIDSHVSDPIYTLNSTRRKLEENDKFLKGSIATNKFDDLILEAVDGDMDKLAKTWEDIKAERVDPEIFLEDRTAIKNRLSKLVSKFGSERVPYAGPECGLNGFPTYECATEYLRRITRAVYDS